MPFKVFITTLLIVINGCLYAQNNIYQFSHLNINDGLSNNQVNCIFKDASGFMWFGTVAGLNRYDAYKFKIFKHDAKNPNSLPDNFVSRIDEGPEHKMWVYAHDTYSIYNPATENFSSNIGKELAPYKISTNQVALIKKDSKANFWFITKNKGLYYYNPKTKSTDFFDHSRHSKIMLHSNWVTDLVDAGDDFVWLIYSDGVIEKVNTSKKTVVLNVPALSTVAGDKGKLFAMTLASDNKLWISANGAPLGVYCYDIIKNTVKNFSKDNVNNKLNSNIINNIIENDDNNIWVGTDHGGINLIDKKSYKINYLLNKYDDPRSVEGNSTVLYKDNEGIIWVGTYKEGVSYYHKSIVQFPLIRHYSSDKMSIPYEDVDRFVEDKKGNIWIGTNGGGLIYFNRETKKYTQYKHDPLNTNSLSNDIIVSLCIDHENKLWIGTYFGGLDSFDGKKFTHFRHDDKIKGSISDDRVYSIIEDSSYNLWVGTFAGGINIYNSTTNNFSQPYSSLNSSYIAVLYEDKQKNIWVGEDKGVDVIQKQTGTIKHYFYKGINQNGLVANDVNSITQDSRGLFWIGTKDGLSILNFKTDKFVNLTEAKNLPINNVLNILEDKEGKMWLSTTNGLGSIKLKKSKSGYSYEIKNYNEFEGLQGREFNVNAGFKTQNGEMIFGGAHGFNFFNPININDILSKPKLVFTDLQLFNKSIGVGDTIKGSIVLTKSITQTQSLVLNHLQNVFSIEFAACDFFNPYKIQYQYKLEGFDKNWLTAPNSLRKATYTNLDAGNYTLKVKAYNGNDVNNASIITLNIEVLPPFWKSQLAYVFYLIVIVSILFYIRHRGIIKLKKEFNLKQVQIETERKIEQEREEAKRMHELDLMKIKFFTNVSHEFRTPLSLIISPIDNLIKENDKVAQQQQLLMIKRNGKRLLNLVNQLLDFRKMEFKELKINLAKGDIIEFILEISSSFTDIALQKHIEFITDSEINSLITTFDHDKIERILFNLLSNAFKFTPSGGHISVLLNLLQADTEHQSLEIKIIDTGIGISKEKQEKVFERFFQDDVPESLLNQGSGIGLSITREFVKMHGGEIKVESELNYGSCFIISLPVGIADDEIVLVPAEQPKQLLNKVSKPNTDLPESVKKPTILLVEDNDDLRFYLKDNLKHHFHIIEAANGKEGWQKTLALHPLLIVSDVNMPEMSGIDLCKKIKNDQRTAHIPLILLTALTESEDHLSGLESGANDYITKPFNFEILLSKIQNLLILQQTIKKTYQKQVDINIQEMDIESEDEKFIKNTINCIEKNINNPNFSVEVLSAQLSLSRVSLYKKLLILTGKPPVDFIKTIRLKRAIQLLQKSKMNIAHIAYEVGFSNPTYFSKVFRDEYGMLPSEYINEMRKKEAQDSVV